MAPNNWHKMDVSSVIAVSDPFIAQSTACDDEIYRRLLQPRIRSKVIPPRANMPPPKTTFAALFMLIGGIIFLLTGLYVYFADLRKESDRGFAMFVLGLLSKFLRSLITALFIEKVVFCDDLTI